MKITKIPVPEILDQHSNSVVRIGVNLEDIQSFNNRLRDDLDALTHLKTDGFVVQSDICELGVKVTISSFGYALGEISVRVSGDGTLGVTADTLLQELEGGGPGAFHLDNWTCAACWISDLIVRLAKLGDIWPLAALCDAVQHRDERLASI